MSRSPNKTMIMDDMQDDAVMGGDEPAEMPAEAQEGAEVAPEMPAEETGEEVA